MKKIIIWFIVIILFFYPCFVQAEENEISNDEILERLKELIPMIRPNLEKFDKSKYPSFDSGVFPKREIKSNIKYNSITGKIIDKEE